MYLQYNTGILYTLTSRLGDNCSQLMIMEAEGIGQTFFGAAIGRYRLQYRSYKRPPFGRLAIHCKPRYVHGERIWLRKTSEGDAEKVWQ